MLSTLFFSLMASASTVVCENKEFAVGTGHALLVKLDQEGLVDHVEKLEGSAHCAGVMQERPPMMKETPGTRVYALELGCPSWNERLIVPREKTPHWIRFDFTYEDTRAFRRARVYLNCRPADGAHARAPGAA